MPNLRNLVLASNHLVELADVDALGTFSRLTHLVLADNPLTKKEVRFCFPLSWEFTDCGGDGVALSLLGHLAVSVRPVSGLRKG